MRKWAASGAEIAQGGGRKICRVRQFDHEILVCLVARRSVLVDDQKRMSGQVARIGSEQNRVMRMQLAGSDRRSEVSIEVGIAEMAAVYRGIDRVGRRQRKVQRELVRRGVEVD